MKKGDETIIQKDMSGVSRRRFLSYTGLAGAGLLLASCDRTGRGGQGNNMPKPTSPDTIDLGSGDVGILNYAYALEQLEAAFYTMVANSPYANMSTDERNLLNDIRDHEIAHREFFKAALGNNAIPALEVNFSSIDFNSRDSVLNTAKAFEDLGVSAYNGAGQLIVTPDYLLLAGKIVSVEARHAGLIRDLISNGTFADSTDNNGMDMAKMPADVLATAATYLKSKVSGNNLPKL